MPAQDTSKIKEEILNFLNEHGPSLPIQISKHIKMDSLFSSAFLSELLTEKKIKTSNLKVGTSPLYLIPGSEEKLEKFSEHLNFKEKEAFILLTQNKFLIEENQEPAIRVALKSIPDFAKSFDSNGKTIWRYFTISKEEYKSKEIPEEKIPEKKIISEIEPEQETPKEKEIQVQKEEPKEKEISVKPAVKKKTIKKKTSQKKNDKFFNTVKEYLISKQIEIIDIIAFSKDDLTLRIKSNDSEKILIAYNKKRITEEEITKAHKKAKEMNMKYNILSFGEPLKRTTSLIDAIRDLNKIEKIE